jgi:hypothetical protein
MLDSLITPLAPAAILLLGAFGLPILLPRLPARWPARQKIRENAASGVVGLALLSLLGLRITYGRDSTGAGLELLSGWNFSTTESVAALMVRADDLSLSFLILTLLVLLVATLLKSETIIKKAAADDWTGQSDWLLLGASTCLLAVSANGLTLVYGVIVFDTIIGFYWLWRGQLNFGVARLFLGIVTAAGLMVATLTENTEATAGLILLGLGLWLRLGLYPFAEATAHRRWSYDERLVYLGLTLIVGFYLVVRMISEPLPLVVLWLVVLTMVFSGLLTWLTGSSTMDASTKRLQLLVWLGLTESLLILAVGPLEAVLVIAYGIGLTLCLVVLWVTPAMGPPRLRERAWSWPYLPAVLATYTIIGLPLSLGWLARGAIYQSLFDAGKPAVVLAVLMAEAFALSGLVRYWSILWQGNERNIRRSTAGIVAMVPFLTPLLGPLALSAITRTDLSPLGEVQAVTAWPAVVVIIVVALGLDHYRNQIINRVAIPVETVLEAFQLHRPLRWGETGLNQVGKILLRTRVTFEGQHYLGWAFFVALVGILVILLR